MFLQYLEGNRDSVLALYGRICADMRHEGCKVVVKQTSQERIFPHWSMAYMNNAQQDLNIVNNILPIKEIMELTRARKIIPKHKILEVLAYFRSSLSQDKEAA